MTITPPQQPKQQCDTGNHVFIEKDGKVFCHICGYSLRLKSY